MTIFFLIDQTSKYLISVYDVHFSLIGNFLKINNTLNEGAAFSLLNGHRYLLIVISFVLILFIYRLIFTFKKSKMNDFAFGILLGGVAGNLFDRILFFGVRDFIDVSLFNFPIFNLADVGITIGVILIIILSFKEDKNENSGK